MCQSETDDRRPRDDARGFAADLVLAPTLLRWYPTPVLNVVAEGSGKDALDESAPGLSAALLISSRITGRNDCMQKFMLT